MNDLPSPIQVEVEQPNTAPTASGLTTFPCHGPWTISCVNFYSFAFRQMSSPQSVICNNIRYIQDFWAQMLPNLHKIA
jgi:hypothetical protein